MICSVTGKVTDVPVVSKASGFLFDKHVIEKLISDTGKCPITGEPLTMDDILLIRTPKIPGSVSTSNSKAAQVSECQKLPYIIIQDIRESCVRLQQYRKYYRQIPTSLFCTDLLQRYVLTHSRQLHKTNMPGMLCLDIHNSKDIIATGGADADAIVYDQVSGNVISKLEGHTKQVTSIKFVKEGDLLLTGSADSTVRVWQQSDDGSYKYKHTLDHHTAEVQAVTIHPSQKYFVTASHDCTWNFYDLSRDFQIIRVACVNGSERFTSASFHPDGHIIGTGTSHFVRFWDISMQDDITRLDAHASPINSIAFSENGYHLATAAEDGVKLWDLRFLRNFMTFPSDMNTHALPVDFDSSGLYLASGGSHISIYNIALAPSCETITTFLEYPGIGSISCLKFGKAAKYVAAGSSDLLIYSLPADDLMQS